MTALARAEWLRLRRRGDLWIVILAVIALNVAGYTGGLSSAQDNTVFFPPGEDVPPDVLEQMEAMARERLAGFAFPKSIETTLQGGQVLILAVAAYMAAAFTGADIEYGTLRTSLVARGDRRGFALVRLAAAFLGAVGLLALVVLLAIVMPLGAAALGTDFPPVSESGLAAAAGMVGAVVVLTAFVVGLTTAAVMAFRNAAVAIVLMLVYSFAESAVQGLIVRLFGPDTTLSWALAIASGRVLFERARGEDLAPLFPTLVAVVLAVAWSAAAWALSIRLLERSDVRS